VRIVIEADSISSPKMSGIGHATLEILRELDRTSHGHKIIAVVPFGRKKKVLSRFKFQNIVVRQLPPGYKYVNYALTRTSLPLPTDLLFGRGVYVFPNYKNWPLLLSKSITFVHDVAYLIEPHTTHPKNLAYLNKNMPIWLKRSDKVISISKQSSKEFNSFFPEYKEKNQTVYLGVDSMFFKPMAKAAIDKTLDRLGIIDSYFLSIGNIEPRKNIERMVKAFKLYKDRGGKVESLLIVGGDGWNNDSIKKVIADCQNRGYKIIKPNAYVDDKHLPGLYGGSSGLVHTAIHEGFGLPPVQALACGVPILVSNIPTFRETLPNNVKTTVFVDPLNEEAIADGMAKLQENTKTSNPEVLYTWKKTVDDLVSICEKVFR
jgi:glycosyltransferase involved in cell wall biosynthesis